MENVLDYGKLIKNSKVLYNFVIGGYYGYSGNDNYRLFIPNGRSYLLSDFKKVANKYPQIIESIGEVKNDAPRGGKQGDNVDVIFVKEFVEVADKIKLEYQQMIKEQIKKENEEKENEERIINEYADLIKSIDGESYDDTKNRLSVALGKGVPAKYFYKAIKLVRNRIK